MVQFKVNDNVYNLRFDMYALEKVEEEFGSIKELFMAIREGRNQTKTVRVLFRIMANCARSFEGLPEDVDDKVILHMPIGRMKELSDTIHEVLNDGMRTETVNGEADDEVHDAYLEEIENNEKKTSAD